MPDLGVVLIEKAAVREVVRKIGFNEWWTAGGEIDEMAVEQATNRIMGLQRPPHDLEEAALTVGCPYCGRTPGNPCHRGSAIVKPHPSRIREVFAS